MPVFWLIFPSVPLGQRRRFGPAPAEDIAPPQLAQPSPSAYPRPLQQDPDSPGRGRDDTPINGGAAGKLNTLGNSSRLPSPSLSSFELDSSARDFLQLISACMFSILLLHVIALTLTVLLTLTCCCF